MTHFSKKRGFGTICIDGFLSSRLSWSFMETLKKANKSASSSIWLKRFLAIFCAIACAEMLLKTSVLECCYFPELERLNCFKATLKLPCIGKQWKTLIRQVSFHQCISQKDSTFLIRVVPSFWCSRIIWNLKIFGLLDHVRKRIPSCVFKFRLARESEARN